MIHDVDESLGALVRRDALNGSQVEVAFDAPNKDWVARRNAPTVDIYLYDIREDLLRREVAYERVRDSSGIVTEHRPPPRRYRLAYLVTAWTQRPEDEHRLLSALLASFIRNPVIPSDLLEGSLVEASVPVYLQVALPPPQDRSLADVWSALGGELKPSIDLIVTAPLDPNVRIDAAAPVLEQPRIRVLGEDGSAEDVAGIAAHRRRRGRGGPLTPAERALQEETVQAGGPAGEEPEPSRPRRGKSKEKDKDSPPDATSIPGRRVTLRGIPRP